MIGLSIRSEEPVIPRANIKIPPQIPFTLQHLKHLSIHSHRFIISWVWQFVLSSTSLIRLMVITIYHWLRTAPNISNIVLAAEIEIPKNFFLSGTGRVISYDRSNSFYLVLIIVIHELSSPFFAYTFKKKFNGITIFLLLMVKPWTIHRSAGYFTFFFFANLFIRFAWISDSV